MDSIGSRSGYDAANATAARQLKRFENQKIEEAELYGIPFEERQVRTKNFWRRQLAGQLTDGAFSINLTTRQALVLDSGRHSSIMTASPV